MNYAILSNHFHPVLSRSRSAMSVRPSLSLSVWEWLSISCNTCIINNLICHCCFSFHHSFLYARLKNGRIMLWQCPSVCPSVRPSVRPSFPDFFSTCFEISIWNLVYAFSRWHDMSSLSFITIGSLWPSLQPKVGQTQFLQSWPYKSR